MTAAPAEPLTTEPPTTEPPTTEPPTTEPPTTEPPTAEPPTAEPPTAELLTARGPATSADPGAPDAAGVELVLGLQLVLGRLVRQLRRVSPGEVGVSGMSALWALVTAGGAAGLRSSDLATAENVSAPTMTRVVDHLVAQGLVRRMANPEDGRSSLVQLTDDGRSVLEAVRDDRGRYLLGRVAALDAGQLRTLADAVPVLALLAEPAAPLS